MFGSPESLAARGRPLRQMPEGLLSAIALAATVIFWLCVLSLGSGPKFRDQLSLQWGHFSCFRFDIVNLLRIEDQQTTNRSLRQCLSFGGVAQYNHQSINRSRGTPSAEELATGFPGHGSVALAYPVPVRAMRIECRREWSRLRPRTVLLQRPACRFQIR